MSPGSRVKGQGSSRVLWSWVLLSTVLVTLGCAEKPESLVLATTTSVQDSGLLDVLLPEFTKATGIEVKPIGVGSGEALAMARRGACDVVLAHSPKAEQTLVDDGVALDRATIMTNTFLIVGPEADPAGVRKCASGRDAFAKIRGHKFVSRGDKSGTHQRELDLWGEKPSGAGYIESATGMGETLMIADQKDAYTLTDIATFLTFKPKLRLVALVESGDDLINRYSVMRVKTGVEGSARFVEWMKKDAAVHIREFGKAKFGRALFTPAVE